MYSNSSRHGSTIGDNVYYILRKNIIDLKLAPGEDISIKDIAETLEVSRSPVRDAILKLGKERLVDTMPQKGTMVSRIDLRRVEEERFIRESLEEKALLLCVERYCNSNLSLLRKRITEQKDCLKTKDYHKFIEYDNLFHEVFFLIADKMLCWEMIQSMSGHYQRIRFITLWDDAIINNVITQHEELVRYLEQRDGEKLIEVLKKHTSKLSIQEKKLLQKYPNYFKQRENSEDNFLKRDFLKMLQ